jgi:hypothetical protein
MTLLNWASWRNILIAWVALVAFSVVAMEPAYSRLRGFSGGAEALDLLIVYRPDKAYDMIAAYGEQGRRYYATITLTLDVIFPFLSALTFGLTLARVFRRAFSNEGALHRAIFVPVGAMVADFLENAGLITMLLSYPRRLTIIALLASSFSTVKWTAVAAESLLVLIGLIAWFVNARLGRSPHQSGIPEHARDSDIEKAG